MVGLRLYFDIRVGEILEVLRVFVFYFSVFLNICGGKIFLEDVIV